MTTNLTHPKGQTVTVPDDAAAYYLEKGWSVAGAETPHEPDEHDVVEIPTGVPEESWKAAELDAYAEREGIDLGTASKKAEKVAVILAALQEKEAAGGADTGSGPDVPDAEAGS